MSDFSITFSYPWLLLILVPALLVSLIPYFRLKKRYRRTRNRITSLILHTTAMVLAIMLLAGMRFEYTIPNTTNELILLVDVSDTETYSKRERDGFVADVLQNPELEGYSVGVVTYGFDQVYAVPLTKDVNSVYDKYVAAESPDTSATDIAAAIQYTATLFKNPDSGKIVLITDGKETDEKALTAVKYVTSQNTKLDVAYVPSNFDGNDVQAVGVKLPETKVEVDKECEIELKVYANYSINATVTMADNGVVGGDSNKEVELQPGDNYIKFIYKFAKEGLHKLDFTVTSRYDDIEKNNVYSTYYDLQIYDKILLVSRSNEKITESDYLNSILSKETNAENKYTVTSTYIGAENFPATIDDLRNYDQIILNNISNSDLKTYEGLDEALYDYVYTYGGGLFTVGGSDGGEENYQGQYVPSAHAYNKKDMYGTKYQEMLPVEAINYTPPAGVIFLLDISGSMGSPDDPDSPYSWAKAGLWAGVMAMSERDYVGVITLDSIYQTVLPLKPRSQEQLIKEAISGINKKGANTLFCDAYRAACNELMGNDKIERRHIIVISDGGIGATEQNNFESLVANQYQTNGITTSIVVIGSSNGTYQPPASPTQSFVDGLIDGTRTVIPGEVDVTSPADRMLRAVWLGNDTEVIEGNERATKEKRESVISKVHVLKSLSDTTEEIRQELESPQIKEVELADYYPTIANLMSPLLNGVRETEGTDIDKLKATLTGFYGTKLRANAELILKASDLGAPLYAEWQFGKGKVGSFMADLYGEFTADFIMNDKAKTFILNVVENLMPSQDVRKTDIQATITEDNYFNRMDVITQLDEDDTIVGRITWTEGGTTKEVSLNSVSDGANGLVYVTTPLTATNNFARCIFVVKRTGTYEIELKRVKKDGTEVATYTIHKSFSYSKEYDEYNKLSDEELVTKLQNIAEGGRGVFIEDILSSDRIFDSFIDAIFRVFDPRILFAIIIILAFLLDVAVRKFKFKWPHEIIREIKEKNSKR